MTSLYEVKSYSIKLGEFDEVGIVVGLIKEDSKLVENMNSYRSEAKHTDVEIGDKNKIDNKTIKLIVKNVLGDIIVIDHVKAIETSKLIAPTIHPINNAHTDGDNFGFGLSLLLYPYVDSTIEEGKLKFVGENFTEEFLSQLCLKTQLKFGYSILEWRTELDKINGVDENVLLFNNKKHIDGYIPFVMFNGNIIHEVEPINGIGIREAVFYYFQAMFR